MQIDEVHGACERGDLVREAQLGVRGPLFELFEDSGMMLDVEIEFGHGKGTSTVTSCEPYWRRVKKPPALTMLFRSFASRVENLARPGSGFLMLVPGAEG